MKIRIVSAEPAIAGRIVEFFRFHKPLEGVSYEHFCPRELVNMLILDEVPEQFSAYSILPLPELGQSDWAADAVVFADRTSISLAYQSGLTYGASYILSSGLCLAAGKDAGDFQPCPNVSGMIELEEDGTERSLSELIHSAGAEYMLYNESLELRELLLAIDPFDTLEIVSSVDMPVLQLNLQLVEPSRITDKCFKELSRLEHLITEGIERLNLADFVHRGQSSNAAYSFFARQYDSYMAHVDYHCWVENIIKWQKRHSGSKCRKVMELACGTANVAGLLCQEGFEVEACDLSRQMLEIAQQKPVKPRLFRQSMTDKLPDGDYDLVICLFDSINYLLKKQEIKATLASVCDALKPGGLFIFDVSTLNNSVENFNDTYSFTRLDKGYLMHHAEYEDFSHKQRSHLYHFVKQPFSYSMERESHVQMVYRHYEIVELIHNSPLCLEAVYSTETQGNLLKRDQSMLDHKYPRLFYILKKPE